MITDAEIGEAIESGNLRIDPLETKNIEAASYELRAGRVLVARGGMVDLRTEAAVLRHGEPHAR